MFFSLFIFYEGKVLGLTALTSLPRAPVGAALCLHHQPHGQLHQSHSCHRVCCPLCCHQALHAPRTPRCSITQHLGAFQQSGALLHGLMDERLVQALSGCLEESECDMVSGFLTPWRAARVTRTEELLSPRTALKHSVCFHTWPSERAKGENASSSTDLHSWLRNISSAVSFTENFVKVPGFGIRIDDRIWEWGNQSSLSGWGTGTVTQQQ